MLKVRRFVRIRRILGKEFREEFPAIAADPENLLLLAEEAEVSRRGIRMLRDYERKIGIEIAVRGRS